MRFDPFYAPTAGIFLGLAHYMLKQYPQARRSIFNIKHAKDEAHYFDGLGKARASLLQKI